MNQPVKQRKRDVGLAEERYLKPGELEWRQEVAGRVREIAKWNDSDWINPGWERFVKRSHRLRKQADRFEVCGLQYSVIQCRGCSRVVVGRRRCEVRICPHCSKKFGARVRQQQVELLKRFPRRNGKWWMLFTVTRYRHPIYRPLTSDAQETFRFLRKLLNEFWPRKSGCGALAVLELGKKGHLHIHVLLYGHFVPHKALSQRWLELTGDSHVVDIRPVRNERKCLNYILKYLTKQSAGKPKKKTDWEEDEDEAMKAARLLDLFVGMRRIRTYGVLYNFPLSSRDACPCPLCGARFAFRGFEDGRLVHVDALFFEEALSLAESSQN